jgi:hypothetical protein
MLMTHGASCVAGSRFSMLSSLAAAVAFSSAPLASRVAHSRVGDARMQAELRGLLFDCDGVVCS